MEVAVRFKSFCGCVNRYAPLMRTNGLKWSFPSDGGWKRSFEITLSTGYTFDITVENPAEGFEHLGQAILGEIFFEKLKEEKTTPDVGEAVIEVVKELKSLVDGLTIEDARSVLALSLWTHVFEHFMEMERRTVKKKRKKEK